MKYDWHTGTHGRETCCYRWGPTTHDCAEGFVYYRWSRVSGGKWWWRLDDHLGKTISRCARGYRSPTIAVADCNRAFEAWRAAARGEE